MGGRLRAICCEEPHRSTINMMSALCNRLDMSGGCFCTLEGMEASTTDSGKEQDHSSLFFWPKTGLLPMLPCALLLREPVAPGSVIAKKMWGVSPETAVDAKASVTELSSEMTDGKRGRRSMRRGAGNDLLDP